MPNSLVRLNEMSALWSHQRNFTQHSYQKRIKVTVLKVSSALIFFFSNETRKKWSFLLFSTDTLLGWLSCHQSPSCFLLHSVRGCRKNRRVSFHHTPKILVQKFASVCSVQVAYSLLWSLLDASGCFCLADGTRDVTRILYITNIFTKTCSTSSLDDRV